MVSTSESGHAVNVANLELLISACAGYDGKYNPSNSNLTVASLQTYLASAQAVIKDVQVKKTAFDTTVNDRKVVFEPIKKVSTRIINALISCGAKSQTIDNARTIVNKIQGRRASSKKQITEKAVAANMEQPKFVSASQQSFDQVVNNFAQLLVIIKSEPLYNPNETDLTASALETLYSTVMTKNSAVLVAETSLNNARINRNKVIYNGDNNIIEITKGVKSYVKSIFGAGSAEFKTISGISFIAL